MSVLIIGAGPAGLAVAAVLGKAGVPYRVLEKSDRIGGAYAQVDPRLLLLTPRELTSLPFAEAEKRAGRISVAEYLEYLGRYQQELRIQVEHGVQVTRVERQAQGFVVRDASGAEHRALKLVLATGSFGFPKPWPMDRTARPGLEYLQAGDWRGIEASRARSFLILGSGIYAAELALALSERFKVSLSVRGKLRFLPASFLGIPIHKWLAPFERLPKFLYPLICEGLFGYHWREPLIDVGLRPAIRKGRVVLCGPDFKVGEGTGPEAVINATGYIFDTSILPPDVARSSKGEVRTRGNESRSHKGLYIIGAHCAGGIDSKYLRGIRRDAMRIGRSIQRNLIG